MKNQENLIIIGGGMAGMAAAIAAARCGERPIVLEKLVQPGKKLLATGNGRCNLMNLGEPIYYGDPGFAAAVMGKNPAEELKAFWQSLGVMLRFDNEGRGYPCTFQASTVLDALREEMKRLNVRIDTGVYVDDIQKTREGFALHCKSGQTRFAKRVILTTGGAAQPRLGGNTDAFAWLEALGHSIIPQEPSLTPLRADKRSVSGLEGLRVKCRVTMRTDGADVHEETGELLFSESGISGICVMQCSRFVIPEKSECLINLVYDLFPDAESLFEELIRRREANTQEEPSGLLRGICAPKLAYAVCKQAGIPLRGETAGELTDAQLRKIAEKAFGYRVRILDREGFDRAQVMAGGASCDEFDPENMESRLCPGLHAAGEVLNVDGDCGGFNLMFACLSGIRAGRNEGLERTS